jgi:hypothetical protein
MEVIETEDGVVVRGSWDQLSVVRQRLTRARRSDRGGSDSVAEVGEAPRAGPADEPAGSAQARMSEETGQVGAAGEAPEAEEASVPPEPAESLELREPGQPRRAPAVFRFFCSECKFKCARWRELIKHRQLHLAGAALLKCLQCEFTTFNRSE